MFLWKERKKEIVSQKKVPYESIDFNGNAECFTWNFLLSKCYNKLKTKKITPFNKPINYCTVHLPLIVFWESGSNVLYLSYVGTESTDYLRKFVKRIKSITNQLNLLSIFSQSGTQDRQTIKYCDCWCI